MLSIRVWRFDSWTLQRGALIDGNVMDFTSRRCFCIRTLAARPLLNALWKRDGGTSGQQPALWITHHIYIPLGHPAWHMAYGRARHPASASSPGYPPIPDPFKKETPKRSTAARPRCSVRRSAALCALRFVFYFKWPRRPTLGISDKRLFVSPISHVISISISLSPPTI